LHTIASTGGIGAAHAARKYGFERVTTDLDAIYGDPGIDTIVVATRHSTHVPLACRALQEGKNVFVEKPLALDHGGLEAIENAYQSAAPARSPLLMVGFNRRFAHHIGEMTRLLRTTRAGKTIVMTVNAGALPAHHWTQDPVEGGGRIVGEACHFIDLARHLVGHPIARVSAFAQRSDDRLAAPRDIATINLEFQDGSLAAIHYLANGHPSVPKERIEVFCSGRVLQLNNFRALHAFGWPGQKTRQGWSQDKGNQACIAAFMDAVRSGGPSPIAFDELMEVSHAAIDAAEAVER
jgi:predicted dehydrogenase